MNDRNKGIEPMNRLSDENLLAAARTLFKYRGVLPLNVAADLIERGFVVDSLEAQWSREITDSYVVET